MDDHKSNVIVENFPSIMELYDQLNTFLDQNEMPKDYDSQHKGNWCKLSFSNSKTAIEFMKHLNIQKISNPLYSKAKVFLQLDSRTACEDKPERSKKEKKNTSSSNNYSLNKSSLAIPRSYFKKNPNTVKVHQSPIYVRISGPYLPYDEMRRKEDLENHKKWMSKQGFISSVGKYSGYSYVIPNYVNMSPSESPLLHKFREVKKGKWVSRKGFI